MGAADDRGREGGRERGEKGGGGETGRAEEGPSLFVCSRPGREGGRKGRKAGG